LTFRGGATYANRLLVIHTNVFMPGVTRSLHRSVVVLTELQR